MASRITIRRLGRQPYGAVYEAMQRFTQSRGPETPDEIWLVEHDPVFTIGKAHAAHAGASIHGIAVVVVDRGGDVTYHGPGQVVAYPLVDLRRRGLLVRDFVDILEASVINTLAGCGIGALTHKDAPGVYVKASGGTGAFAGKAKIASLGVHVSRGCTYHGLALNVDMDLKPFSYIAPCGYQGLRVTDMRTQGADCTLEAACDMVQAHLLEQLERHE